MQFFRCFFFFFSTFPQMVSDSIEKSICTLILFITSLLNSIIPVITVHRAYKLDISARGATLYIFTSMIPTAWIITECSSVCALRALGSVFNQRFTCIWQGWSRFYDNTLLILAIPNWKLQLLLCTYVAFETHICLFVCFFLKHCGWEVDLLH